MHNNLVILLSGTPASGKDTITEKLNRINSKFELFRKHKFGLGGKKDQTYIHIEEKDFNSLINSSEFIQYHTRYDRGYGVSKKELESLLRLQLVPIIHVGKYENILPFKRFDQISCFNVLLTASKESTIKRLSIRHPNDINEQSKRLAAYNEERQELANLFQSGKEIDFHLIINTDLYSENQVAEIILSVISI